MKWILWLLGLSPLPIDIPENVVIRTRVETHELGRPVSAVIERRTFDNGSVGYVVLIIDHTLRRLGEGELADILAGRVWTGERAYWTVKGARKHIWDELERACDYWARVDGPVF